MDLLKRKGELAKQGIDVDTQLNRMNELVMNLEETLFIFTEKYEKDPSPLTGGAAIGAITAFASRILASTACQMKKKPDEILKNFYKVLSSTLTQDYEDIIQKNNEKKQ